MKNLEPLKYTAPYLDNLQLYSELLVLMNTALEMMELMRRM
jgi:hypothetical protein